MRRCPMNGLRAVLLGAVLAGAAGCAEQGPVTVLMIVGGIYHDYETLPPQLARDLMERGGVQIDITSGVTDLDPARVGQYDVLMFNNCTQDRMDPATCEAIVDHVETGGGLVAMHCALWSFQWWPEWTPMLGGFAPGHDKYGPYEVTVTDADHPVAADVPETFETTDEPYTVDRRDASVDLIVRTSKTHRDREGKPRDGPEPQVWGRHVGRGRVLAATFGHDEPGQTNPHFLRLMHNGILWTAGREAD